MTIGPVSNARFWRFLLLICRCRRWRSDKFSKNGLEYSIRCFERRRQWFFVGVVEDGLEGCCLGRIHQPYRRDEEKREMTGKETGGITSRRDTQKKQGSDEEQRWRRWRNSIGQMREREHYVTCWPSQLDLSSQFISLIHYVVFHRTSVNL